MLSCLLFYMLSSARILKHLQCIFLSTEWETRLTPILTLPMLFYLMVRSSFCQSHCYYIVPVSDLRWQEVTFCCIKYSAWRNMTEFWTVAWKWIYVNHCNIGRVKQWLCTKLVNESDKNCWCLEDWFLCHMNFVYEITFQEFDQTWFVCVEHE